MLLWLQLNDNDNDQQHINILPEAQRQGWGRRLFSTQIAYLKSLGVKRMFLGYDPRNSDAAAFYAKMGFKHIEGAPETCVGLELDEFRS